MVFPIRGHSNMPADRAFGMVESKIRMKKELLLPEQYDKICREFGTLHVHGIDFNWLNCQDLSKTSIMGKKTFKISRAKRISLHSKSGRIGIRENYMEPLGLHTLLKRGKCYRSMLLSLCEKDCKSHVTAAKRDDVIKILKVMGHVPKNIPFYKNALMIINESDDESSDSDTDGESDLD